MGDFNVQHIGWRRDEVDGLNPYSGWQVLRDVSFVVELIASGTFPNNLSSSISYYFFPLIFVGNFSIYYLRIGVVHI